MTLILGCIVLAISVLLFLAARSGVAYQKALNDATVCDYRQQNLRLTVRVGELEQLIESLRISLRLMNEAADERHSEDYARD